MPEPKTKKPLIAAIAAAALIGVAGLVYAVLPLGSKGGAANLEEFATGPLAKLEVLPTPPAQPAVKFTDAKGAEHTLAEWRGKVVVVNFWATWCAPCTKEMPGLAALATSLKGKPAEVVAISVDKVEDRDFAIRRLNELSTSTLAFYSEPSYAIAFDTEAKGFPTTIIYARDGRELARLSGGEVDWAAPQAKRLIEAALAK
jgi:thiol-disulfide isomerase/thioredoxin